MTDPLDLAAVKARCAEAICADCGGDGQFGLRQHACDSCGGHEDAAGRGIVDDATAVRVMTDDVPALVAEVERLAANLDTFREAIRLLLARCDDDPDEAAHTPPHIRQAIMDYDQRAALRAAGGG